MDFLERAAVVYEDIAAKRKLDVKDVIGIIRELAERRAALNYSRRADDHEKELIAAELPKLNADALARLNAKQIHAELVTRGISVRKNHGVLTVISKTRTALLQYAKQPQTQAAE